MTLDGKILQAVEEMRTGSKMHDDKRDEGLPTEIPEVERINDLSYGPDPKWNLLDIYLPKKRTGKVPVIISIHGGGWVYGTKETYQFYGLGLAKEGFAFVNFNYRLAPDVQFPGEMDDVNRLMHWVAEHGAEYDLDTGNVFLVGDSAGGQMEEQYLAILTNDKFRQLFGYELPKLTVRAAALNCGAYFMLTPGFTDGAPSAYFTPEAVSGKEEMLNTEKYLTQNLPPLFIMTANQDFLHDSAVRLDGYLLAKEIPHELHIYGDMENPRGHVFHCNQRDDIAKQCNLDELNFFRKHLTQ